MTFEFRIGSDGTMDVIGVPTNDSGGEAFRRTGPYRVDGSQLVSPALNEGLPVHIQLRAGMLFLTIDKSLAFQLRRVGSTGR
jgi:hypothetical protein